MSNDEVAVDYAPFIQEIKNLIYEKQYRVLKLINSDTISLNWEIGNEILRQQQEKGWGKSVVNFLSKELQKEFPSSKGYSASNLWRMRNFYLTYCESEKLAPLVREISWTINVAIMEKCKDEKKRSLCPDDKKIWMDKEYSDQFYRGTDIRKISPEPDKF